MAAVFEILNDPAGWINETADPDIRGPDQTSSVFDGSKHRGLQMEMGLIGVFEPGVVTDIH